MADCVDIKLERIRAHIQIGNHYYVTTGTDYNAAGDIMSFSINKSRGQAIATFRCQLSVWADAPIAGDLETTDNNVGERVIVHAGVGENSDTNLPRLFTGYVTNITQDPHWDDARKYILNISGEDEFALMKYGNKFSRRFKAGDDSFAVITGGRRREGGHMTKLRRVPPGKRGVENIAAGSNESMEHSPLIRTPDPQGLSPNAASPGSSAESETAKSPIRFSQSNAYMSSGDKIFVTAEDEDGNILDPNTLKNTEGTKCLCCCNPPPSSFDKSGGTTKAEGLDEGKKTYPVAVKYTTQGGKGGFEFTVTGDYPSKVTFIHPLTGQSCTITFNQVPPHSHESIPQGGPAKGSYDVFQV